ncbi:MAG: HGxxPAAW family protein [Nostocoides sp.]
MSQTETNERLGEGHSVAAWLTVIILSVAAVVLGAGIMAGGATTIVIGAVLIILGLIIGWLMAAAGYGAKPPAPRAPLEL